MYIFKILKCIFKVQAEVSHPCSACPVSISPQKVTPVTNLLFILISILVCVSQWEIYIFFLSFLHKTAYFRLSFFSVYVDYLFISVSWRCFPISTKSFLFQEFTSFSESMR